MVNIPVSAFLAPWVESAGLEQEDCSLFSHRHNYCHHKMRVHMHQAVYITQENTGCRGPSPEALGHGQILIGKVKN